MMASGLQLSGPVSQPRRGLAVRFTRKGSMAVDQHRSPPACILTRTAVRVPGDVNRGCGWENCACSAQGVSGPGGSARSPREPCRCPQFPTWHRCSLRHGHQPPWTPAERWDPVLPLAWCLATLRRSRRVPTCVCEHWACLCRASTSPSGFCGPAATGRTACSSSSSRPSPLSRTPRSRRCRASAPTHFAAPRSATSA